MTCVASITLIIGMEKKHLRILKPDVTSVQYNMVAIKSGLGSEELNVLFCFN